MFKTLRQRWLFYFILLLILTTIVLDTVVQKSLRDFLRNLSLIQLERDTNLVALVVDKESLILKDAVDYKRLADELSIRLKARVTFIDAKGVVSGDSDIAPENLREIENHANRPEVISAYKGVPGRGIRYSHTLKVDMAYVAIPMKKGEQIVGVIRVSRPLFIIDSIIRDVRKILFIGSVLAITLASLVGLFFINRMVKPIRQMIEAAQQISQERFFHKIRTNSQDELQILADALNVMSDKLESRFRNIQEEKQQLQTILASMAEGVMVMDKRGRITLTNEAFRRIFMVSDPIIDKTPIEIIRNPEVAQALIDGVNSGQMIKKEVTLAGNSPKVVRLYAAPLWDDGKQVGLVTVFHDITDIRNLEQVRRDFVANVSHELRTPLTAVQGFSETLLDGALDQPDFARKFVQNIYTQTQRMTALVLDLLCLSQIESGKIRMEFVPTDVRDMIRSALEVVSSKAQKRNVTVDIQMPDEPVMLNLDRKYFCQALINLLDNAIKFSDSGMMVQLLLNVKDDVVTIQLIDTGCGIPQEDLPRIFERFYRVDKSRSAETEGTGLGLAICRHIVEVHHGTIAAESVLGKGTSFILSFKQ